ncbi:MAG: hypothetical protein ABR971_07195 [Acidobacteriaceae bacterium]|jgi:hypothetical protein
MSMFPTCKKVHLSARPRTFGQFAIALIVGFGAHSAGAQGTTPDLSDFNSIRSDALLGTSPTPVNPPTFGSVTSGFGTTSPVQPSAPQPPPFNLSNLNPFNYFNQDANGSDESAYEATPEVKFGFITRPARFPLQFSGFVDESSDRFSGAPSNSDRFDGSLRIDFVGSKPFPARDRLIAYISYSPQRVYAPFFSTGGKITQDVAVGLNKLWDFNNRFRPILHSGASYVPMWEIGLQVSGQHRFVNSPPDSNSISFSPSIKWTATNHKEVPFWSPDYGDLAASVSVLAAPRWYSAVNAISERVWGVTPVLTITWAVPPAWFGRVSKIVGKAELDFQTAYTDQTSTVATDSYHKWAVGPTLRTGWNF